MIHQSNLGSLTPICLEKFRRTKTEFFHSLIFCISLYLVFEVFEFRLTRPLII